jgi:hypothetical protein
MVFIEVLFILSCVAGLVVMLYIHHQYPEGIDPDDGFGGSDDGGLPPTGDSVPVGPRPELHVPTDGVPTDEQPSGPRVSA